jgi:hypothetical protein
VPSVTAVLIHWLLSFEMRVLSIVETYRTRMRLVKVCSVSTRGQSQNWAAYIQSRYSPSCCERENDALGIGQTGLLSWVIVGAVGLSPIIIFFIARVISEVFRRRPGERLRGVARRDKECATVPAG